MQLQELRDRFHDYLKKTLVELKLGEKYEEDDWKEIEEMIDGCETLGNMVSVLEEWEYDTVSVVHVILECIFNDTVNLGTELYGIKEEED